MYKIVPFHTIKMYERNYENSELLLTINPSTSQILGSRIAWDELNCYENSYEDDSRCVIKAYCPRQVEQLS